jgi:hypothetical protein
MTLKRMTAIAFSIMLIAALAGCEGDQGPAGPAGAAGADGQDGACAEILGFASVAADGTVLAWGGATTTNVSVSKGAAGTYTVTFTGNYTGVTGPDNVTYYVSSSNTQTFDVAALRHDNNTASPTEIQATVWTWSTNTNPPTQKDAACSVLILKQ